jgi:putative MATE family efflux protein
VGVNLKRKKSLDILNENVGTLLFKMTYPMLFGVFAIAAFNFTDTFFVSMLGTKPLAAISYTFPVIMLAGGIALGIGIGASSLIARTIGEGKKRLVPKYTSESLILGILAVVVITIIGLSTMHPFFKLLGASEEILPEVVDYMTIWYIGLIFMVIPMVGNNCMRGFGDMMTPCIAMMSAAFLNIILDPIMIFGLLGCPKMGIRGAALATVISRGIALFIVLYALIYKHSMLKVVKLKFRSIFTTWWKILKVGTPAAITNLLVPFAVGYLTMLSARYGNEAIASVGVGRKIEQFVVMVYAAVGASMVPFVGQNFGAKKYGRIKKGIKITLWFSVIYGGLVFVLFLFTAKPISSIFSKNPVVIRDIAIYLIIVSISYGMQGIWTVACQIYNAVNQPMKACHLNFILFIILYLPLLYIGGMFFQLHGLFVGVCIANILGGIVALLYIKRTIRNAEEKYLAETGNRLISED